MHRKESVTLAVFLVLGKDYPKLLYNLGIWKPF